MNQRRVRVWHSAGRVRRKTAPTGPAENWNYRIYGSQELDEVGKPRQRRRGGPADNSKVYIFDNLL